MGNRLIELWLLWYGAEVIMGLHWSDKRDGCCMLTVWLFDVGGNMREWNGMAD